MNEIKILVEQFIGLIGIHGASVVPIRYALFFIIAIFLSWFSGWAGWYIIRPIIQKISSKTPTQWNSILFNDTVLRTFCKIIPAVVIWKLLPLVVFQHAILKDIVTRLTGVYICVMVVKLLLVIIKSIETTKTQKDSKMQLYAKSFLGVVRIVLFFLAAIVIIATLLNKNPLTLLAGLGATSAILMLVFQDTIQGLVAGIRLNSNEMVRIGDWITVPGTPADGIVEDVTLTTVKVRNFDNTTATVTPMSLVNGSFQNWRSMKAGAGHRVTRLVYFDFRSIGFVSDEQKQALISKELFTADELKGNHINIALYRQYIERYISGRKDVAPEMGVLVREVEATQAGLPLGFLFFVKNDPAVHYEHTLAEIMEWCYAMANEFKLTIYQQFPNQNA